MFKMLQKEESVAYQWALTLLCNMPVFTYGLQAGWQSGAGRLLQSADSPAGRPLTDSDISWMASIVCLTGMVGAPLAAWLSDAIGRKRTLLLISALQVVSWGLKLYSSEPAMLLTARALLGVPAGGCFVVPNTYVREISSARMRGALGSVLMFSVNAGLLIMYIMSSAFDYHTILWICTPLPVLHILLTLLSPESPSYLIKEGKIEEATRVLAKLRGLKREDKRVENEASELREENERARDMPPTSFKTIYEDVACRRGVLLCALLLGVQAGGGNLCVLMYAATLMEGSGIDTTPEVQAIAIGTLFTLGGAVSIVLIERVGRKPLQMASVVLMTILLAILSIPPILAPLGVPLPPPWLPALTLPAIVFSYAVGLAPIPYVVLSEIFSFQVRARVTGVLVTYAWLVSFLQLIVFSPMYVVLGNAAFVAFFVLNLLGSFATFYWMPETKGRSLTEIQARLRGDKPQYKSCDLLTSARVTDGIQVP